jgi:hypothetical protein
MGAGRGNAVEVEVTGGIVGLVVDTRGRPLEISTDSAQRVSDLKQWTQALAVYPKT